jgi:hypothetical protein
MAPEWKTKEKLVDALVRGGFEDGRVEVYSQETDAGFGSEEERWTYFCHPFWGMWRKGWSEEETARWDEAVREEVVRFAGKEAALLCVLGWLLRGSEVGGYLVWRQVVGVVPLYVV